ncbi:MAG: ATP-binding protein [Thermodesulfobacteriota bacterium]
MADGAINLLFLEDEQMFADLVMRMLATAAGPNLSVTHFTALKPAMDWLSDHTPDAVLLDLNLSDSSGLDTLDQMLSVAPGVPVVVLTGLGEEEMALAALSKGAEEYLIKNDVKMRMLWLTLQFAILRRQLAENKRNARQQLEARVQERTAELEATNLALRRSEERYRFLVETMNEGVIRGDGQGRIVFVNEKVIRMLDFQRDELLGRDVLTLAADQANVDIMLYQRMRRQQGLTDSYEVALAKRDGGRFHALFSSRPILGPNGDYEGFLAVITDISKRKLLENQLLQSQKLEAIGQLAAGIAHEINTPIQYVSDNTRFIRDSLESFTQLFNKHLELAQLTKAAGAFPELTAEMERTAQEIDLDYMLREVPVAIEQIEEGLRRVSEIVRSMKEFAHPGSEQKTLADINHVIENTIMVARNEWKYVADIKLDLSPDLPLVPCIPGDLQQIMLNIVVNAAQAIGGPLGECPIEKGLITVSSRQVERWAEIRVSDTGPGIAPEIQRRVFDPFFTTKPVGKGTGQGLAIAYAAVVERHQGEIFCESALGSGATFIVRLPLEAGSGRQESGLEP